MLYPESFLGCGFEVRVLISPDYLVFETPLTHIQRLCLSTVCWSLWICMSGETIEKLVFAWRSEENLPSVLGTRVLGAQEDERGDRRAALGLTDRPFLWDFRESRAACPPLAHFAPESVCRLFVHRWLLLPQMLHCLCIFVTSLTWCTWWPFSLLTHNFLKNV